MKRIKPRLRHFYVYVLFDADAVVRYIGKGKGNRWLAHDKGNDKNNWRKNRFIKQALRKLGEVPKVKIREDLLETEAFEIEVVLIRAIGRFPNGPLYNLTDNRNGPSSERIKQWHASRTPEERSATAKKSQSKITPEQREAIRIKRAAKADPVKLSATQGNPNSEQLVRSKPNLAHLENDQQQLPLVRISLPQLPQHD